MSNTHLIPDSAFELQAICSDLLPACILSTTFPTVPVSSLTLAAFATHGYVRDGANLIYVNQAAAPVTLSGADGIYWLALHRNTATAVTLWTRQPGTHYLWRGNPTVPADPAGGLVLAQVTVAGGVITAILITSAITSHSAIPFGNDDGALTFDPTYFRYDAATHALALGTPTPATAALDIQSQHAVAIQVNDYNIASLAFGFAGLVMAGSTKWNLYMSGTGQNYLKGFLGIDTPGGVAAYPLHVVGAIYGTTTMGLGIAPGAVASLRMQSQAPVGIQIEDFFVASQAIAYAGLVMAGAGKWNVYMSGNAGNYFAGNVGINTTDVTTYQLFVNGTAGKPGGGSWSDSSERRWKKNIRDIPGALGTLLQLRGRRFQWDEAEHIRVLGPGDQYGFVIEDVEPVMPHWVNETAEGHKILTVRGFEALAVEAIRGMAARLLQLEQRVQALETLEARVAALEALP